MPEAPISSTLLDPGVPAVAVLAALAVALALWAASHRVDTAGRPRWVRIGHALVRIALAAASIALGCEAVGRIVDLAPAWQLALLALFGGIGIELVVGLYALERGTVGRAGGGAVTALRAVLVLLILAMLAQPTFSRQSSHADERFVAVLVDDSASMGIGDATAAAGHRLAWLPIAGVQPGGAQPAADAEAAWAALPQASRDAVEAILKSPRTEQARRLLDGSVGGSSGLLARLGESYTPRVFRFSSEAVEVTNAPSAVDDSVSNPMRTDLAAALRRVRESVPASRLAGVIILSDGRHNADTDPGPIAQHMGDDGVRVSAVVVGEERGLADAAIVAVNAAPVVILGDELVVNAGILVRRLEGRDVRVTLHSGDEVVGEQVFRADKPEVVRPVEFRHRPQRLGLGEYRLKVHPVEGEAVALNNERSLHVSVTDQPATMLLIDDRPRWEYRYLRSLFADRDRSVKLQHVLLNPDWITGAPDRTLTPASAARSREDSEATALPVSAEAWSAFDVVVLGDVSPAQMGPEHAESLRRFVEEHGGRLVVVAGVNYMPHAWDGGPMRDLLPVSFQPGDSTEPGGPLGAVRVALTPAGEKHTVTRLETDTEANRVAWSEAPPLLWYHPVERIKPGATVLASAAAPASGEDAEGPPLIVEHRFGKGAVLMLLFDSTWRLRYRHGDAYHHRFWGQVVRWATADQLPLGNEHVRFGADRVLYAADEPVTARAKLRNRAMEPIAGAELWAVVTRDGQSVRRSPMAAVEGSAGDYEASIGALPSGEEYDVTLQIASGVAGELRPEASRLIARIAVDTGDPRELVESGADRATLHRLAEATGGVVVSPGEWERVLASLGPGTRTVVQEHRYAMWHGWPLLLTITLVATLEWVMRKRMGLP